MVKIHLKENPYFNQPIQKEPTTMAKKKAEKEEQITLVEEIPVKEETKPAEKDFNEHEYIIKVRDEHRVIGLEEEIHAIEVAVDNDFPVLAIGDTGMGKTYVIQHVATKRAKHALRVSLNGEIGINELLGKWLVKDGTTFWQDGTLTSCMCSGDWIILDEINAALPEVLFCLNALLDDGRSIVLAEKDNELIVPHPDFRVFATMNPTEDYAGTKDLNPALLSRFCIVLQMKHYKPEVERDIVVYQSGIDPDTAGVMVDTVNLIRQSRKEGKTWFICSTRDIVNWSRLFMSNDMTLAKSFVYSIYNKAPINEREPIRELLKAHSEIGEYLENKKGARTDGLYLTRKEIEKTSKEIEKLQEKKSQLQSAISKEIQKVMKV